MFVVFEDIVAVKPAELFEVTLTLILFRRKVSIFPLAQVEGVVTETEMASFTLTLKLVLLSTANDAGLEVTPSKAIVVTAANALNVFVYDMTISIL